MARRSKPVVIVIKGDDKASGVLGKVHSEMKDLETSGKSLTTSMRSLQAGWMAGTAAVGAMTAALFKLAEAAADQERVEKRLEAVYRTTGGAVGLSVATLEDYATALGRATMVGDEAILEIESILLTFRKISGNVFKETTERVFDLAEVMQTDAKSAALQLGKALNDPVTGISALTRVGISFTEVQKKQIKHLAETNHLMDAQAIILRELQSEFGGAARAAGETFGGQLVSLKNDFIDLAQATGKPLLPGLTEFVGDLRQIVQYASEMDAAKHAITGFFDSLAASAPIAAIMAQVRLLAGIINPADPNTVPFPQDLADKLHPARATLPQIRAQASPFKALPGGPQEMEEQGLPSSAVLDARRALQDSYDQEELNRKIAHAQQITEIENDGQSINLEQFAYFEETRTRIAQEQAAQRVEATRMGLQAMATLFPKVKAFAIGESLINTYQSITKTLASVPYPYNVVAAAFVGAQGFAQVRAIQSQGISTGGGGTSSYTYGGASATVPQAPAQAATNVTINVAGGTRIMTPEDQAQMVFDALESHLKETGNKVGSLEFNMINGG